MELRNSQAKEEDMPSSLGQNNHHHHHLQTSVSSNPALVSQTLGNDDHHHGRRLQDSNPDPSAAQLPAPADTGAAGPTVRYRECLKNHAASMGSHVLDGCGEFMPAGEDGTPESLKCAACECHRNFHRKEAEGELQSYPPSHFYYTTTAAAAANNSNQTKHKNNILQRSNTIIPCQRPRFSHHGFSTSPSTAPVAPIMMAFGSVGGPAESSSEDLHMANVVVGGQTTSYQVGQSSKKRFRTKFSQEQKDRMMEFAEKVGWRIQRQDDEEVLRFCNEVGVKRQVFKVWMHNNKQAMKKKNQ